jgi:hypothetical protein
LAFPVLNTALAGILASFSCLTATITSFRHGRENSLLPVFFCVKSDEVNKVLRLRGADVATDETRGWYYCRGNRAAGICLLHLLSFFA